MPAPRKIFRIEQCAHNVAPSPASTEPAETELRHHEYLTELKALRALIENEIDMRAVFESGLAVLDTSPVHEPWLRRVLEVASERGKAPA